MEDRGKYYYLAKKSMRILLPAVILLYLFHISNLSFKIYGSTENLNIRNGAGKFVFFYLSVIFIGLGTMGNAYFVFKGSRLARTLKSIFITFILLMTWVKIYEYRENKELEESLVAYGICYKKSKRIGSNIVFYEFSHNGNTVYGHQQVEDWVYKRYHTGDTVFIIDVSSNRSDIFKVRELYNSKWSKDW